MRNVNIYPVLRYQDADAAIAWLGKAFGFTEKSVHRDEEGKVAHAELGVGEGTFMIGESTVTDGNGSAYVAVEEVDAHHDRAKSAGAEIIVPLTDQDYGSREYGAKDLEGNTWYFGTYTA